MFVWFKKRQCYKGKITKKSAIFFGNSCCAARGTRVQEGRHLGEKLSLDHGHNIEVRGPGSRFLGKLVGGA